VDAPERGERYYNEAAERLRQLAGDVVGFEPGPRAEDSYSGLLFYIYAQNGESIDEALIREGLATAWTRDGQHRDRLVGLERKAWRQGGGVCGKSVIP